MTRIEFKNIIIFLTIITAGLFLANCTKPKPNIIIPKAKAPTALNLLNCKAGATVNDTKTLDLYPGDGAVMNEDATAEDPSKRIFLGVMPEPKDASIDNLVWSSNSTNIEIDETTGGIRVDANATPETSAEISVTTKDGKVSDSCLITIRNKASHITELDIFNEKSKSVKNKILEVSFEHKHQLLALATKPTNASNITGFKWKRKSGNTDISVNENTGVVSVASESSTNTINSTAIIEVTSPNGVKAETTIKPRKNIGVSQVVVDHQTLSFVAEQTAEQEIFVAVRPANAFNKNLDVAITSNSNNTGTGANNGVSVSPISGTSKYKVKVASTTKIGDKHTITFKAKDGSNKSVDVLVNIVQQPVPVTNLVINENQASIKPLVFNSKRFGYTDSRKEQMQLSVTISPTSATNKNVLWQSNNENVVKVVDGYLQAIGVGTATITAISQDNISHRQTRNIEVINGTNISSLGDIVYTDGFILYGESASDTGAKQIQTTITPATATNKTIFWISTNPDVLKIESDGADPSKATITPQGEGGQSTIVAIAQDGNIVKKLTINTASLGMKSIDVGNGINVPTGVNDTGATTLTQNFTMAKTELVFSLWREVYMFATTEGKTSGGAPSGKRKADNGNLYKFQSTGNMGNGDPSAPKSMPVAGLTYKDALAFSNAMTEYYNYKKNLTSTSKLTAYYKIGSSTFRDATGSTSNFNTASAATGFRLPTNAEWEFIARLTKVTDSNYIVTSGGNTNATLSGTTYNFLKGTRASGEAPQAGSNPAKAVKDVAWFKENSAPSNSSTQYLSYPVALKKPNALGIYDMSGNIAEFVYSGNPNTATQAITKGGRFDSTSAQTGVGQIKQVANDNSLPRMNVGVRLVRNTQ